MKRKCFVSLYMSNADFYFDDESWHFRRPVLSNVIGYNFDTIYIPRDLVGTDFHKALLPIVSRNEGFVKSYHSFRVPGVRSMQFLNNPEIRFEDEKTDNT